jgi:hypothetical protein
MYGKAKIRYSTGVANMNQKRTIKAAGSEWDVRYIPSRGYYALLVKVSGLTASDVSAISRSLVKYAEKISGQMVTPPAISNNDCFGVCIEARVYDKL